MVAVGSGEGGWTVVAIAEGFANLQVDYYTIWAETLGWEGTVQLLRLLPLHLAVFALVFFFFFFFFLLSFVLGHFFCC